MAAPASLTVTPAAGPASRKTQWRLFLTCWVVYALHFSPFVTRELYVVMNLAEKQTARVDEYVDLHPDLFTIPGRGAFLGSNPGVAFLAAVPYALVLPVLNRVAPVRPPSPGAEETAGDYRESRPNRLAFFKKVRERGLGMRLGAAAAVASVLFMAPLAALSVAMIFRLFGQLGFSGAASLWLSLLYAFGTPIFFRSGTLSQNLLVALLGFFALLLVWWPSGARPQRERWRYFFAGVLAGWAVFTDYTGVVTVGVLGLLALWQQMGEKPFGAALRRVLPFVAGVLIPIGFLLLYQWVCFGNPWLPAQYYMPKEIFRGYPSARGFGWPLPVALWGLLFDPLYGLFVFAPVLAVALYHPLLVRRGQNRVPGRVAAFSWIFLAALWLFSSCIHYTVRHQWQDGVRYMVPAVLFLFLLVADVLARMPRGMVGLFTLAAVLETWCLAMVREGPSESLARVLRGGFELPWLTTMIKAAPQYFPGLAEGASPLPVLLLAGLLIWGIWRVPRL